MPPDFGLRILDFGFWIRRPIDTPRSSTNRKSEIENRKWSGAVVFFRHNFFLFCVGFSNRAGRALFGKPTHLGLPILDFGLPNSPTRLGARPIANRKSQIENVLTPVLRLGFGDLSRTSTVTDAPSFVPEPIIKPFGIADFGIRIAGLTNAHWRSTNRKSKIQNRKWRGQSEIQNPKSKMCWSSAFEDAVRRQYFRPSCSKAFSTESERNLNLISSESL